jgi:cell division protein FtsB
MDRVIGTAKAFLLPAAIGALMVYFCYHALAGEQGLAAWADLQIAESDLEEQITALKTQRAALDEALSRLRDRTLDLDFIEEIARSRLSYVRPDELLVSSR